MAASCRAGSSTGGISGGGGPGSITNRLDKTGCLVFSAVFIKAFFSVFLRRACFLTADFLLVGFFFTAFFTADFFRRTFFFAVFLTVFRDAGFFEAFLLLAFFGMENLLRVFISREH